MGYWGGNLVINFKSVMQLQIALNMNNCTLFAAYLLNVKRKPLYLIVGEAGLCI
jgi:hypothetical protein